MGSGPHATGIPMPALVFETLTAYQRTAALRAAIELGLFRALGEGPGDVTSLALACSASERGNSHPVRLPDRHRPGGEAGRPLQSHAHQRAVSRPPFPQIVSRRSRDSWATRRLCNRPCTWRTSFARPYNSVRRWNPGAGKPGLGRVRPTACPDDGAHGRPARFHRPGWTASGPMSVLDIAAGHGLFGIEVAGGIQTLRLSPWIGPSA
jgi:hypothetical protein